MSEQLRENPEAVKYENSEALKTAIEKQRLMLEQIDTETRKGTPNNELLGNLITQMEEANQEAQVALDAFRKSMGSDHK
jgi:hypothetical protein